MASRVNDETTKVMEFLMQQVGRREEEMERKDHTKLTFLLHSDCAASLKNPLIIALVVIE